MPINVGALGLSKIGLGGNDVPKVYLGSALVFGGVNCAYLSSVTLPDTITCVSAGSGIFVAVGTQYPSGEELAPGTYGFKLYISEDGNTWTPIYGPNGYTSSPFYGQLAVKDIGTYPDSGFFTIVGSISGYDGVSTTYGVAVALLQRVYYGGQEQWVLDLAGSPPEGYSSISLETVDVTAARGGIALTSSGQQLMSFLFQPFAYSGFSNFYTATATNSSGMAYPEDIVIGGSEVNNLIVAVGVNSGTSLRNFMTSSDGVSWTYRDAPESNWWTGVAWGDGKFVAVARSGSMRVATSTDGITWTGRTAAENNYWNAVAYGGGLFVAVANQGVNRMMASLDGIRWFSVAGMPTDLWTDIEYGNGKFIVSAGGGGSNVVLFDPVNYINCAILVETITIQSVSAQLSGSNRVLTVSASITTAGGFATQDDLDYQWQYAAVGSNTWTNIADSAGSVSGANTASLTLSSTYLELYSTRQHRVVVSSVFAADSVTSDAVAGLTQSNVTITQQPQNTTTATSTASFSVTATSSDGSTLSYQWEEETLANDGATWTTTNSLPDSRWRGLAYGNGLFVTLGYNSNVAATSPDGVTWTPRTTPNSRLWYDLVYGNGIFVAVSSAVAATSVDGSNWTERTLPDTINWFSVAYGGGLFVTVGSNSDIAATSPDGINWTQRTLPAAALWRSVTYGNGLFVAVASNNNIAATSPDGINWTQRTLPAVGDWESITYGNGIFIAVNVDPGQATIVTSPNGITWTQQTLPSLADLPELSWWNAVAYGGGLFVAISSTNSSSNPFAATSRDGITWTPRFRPSNSNLRRSITYGNGAFVVVPYGSDEVRISNSTSLQFFPLSGKTSNTLALTGLTESDNGTRYRVIVDSLTAVEPVTSTAATLSVTFPVITFTIQPQNDTADLDACYSPAAPNNPVPYSSEQAALFSAISTVSTGSQTFQWQTSSDNGVSWTNISNGRLYQTTTGSYWAGGNETALWLYSYATPTGMANLSNGALYRVVATSTTNPAISVASNAVTLTVPVPTITITTQPTNYATAGSTAAFAVQATKNFVGYQTAPNYQWQRSNDNGVTWTDWMEGATYYQSTLQLSGLTYADNWSKWRCLVYSYIFCGGEQVQVLAYSDVATLTTPGMPPPDPGFVLVTQTSSDVAGIYTYAGTYQDKPYYVRSPATQSQGGVFAYLYWADSQPAVDAGILLSDAWYIGKNLGALPTYTPDAQIHFWTNRFATTAATPPEQPPASVWSSLSSGPEPSGNLVSLTVP